LLKLLYITTNLNSSGGVARVLSLKLNYLVEVYFYDIHVINTHGDSNNLFYFFNDKISIHSLNQNDCKHIRVFNYVKKLNNKINEINPDIIVNCDNGLKGALLPFLYYGNAPLIYENHSSKDLRENSIIGNLKLQLKDFFFSRSVLRYEKIVVFQIPEGVYKSKNIKVIHNPLAFKIPIKNTLFNKKIVLAVGRISYEKGYDTLIKIWNLVIKKHSDWQLHIYGDGDCKQVKQQIKNLKVLASIVFFKPTLNIKQVYLNASILINTSRHESFGMSLIEAMACGLPVLAFKNTLGPKIFIKNNENGFLIEKDNLKAYANKIISLIEDKNEMKRVGEKAKESVERFDLNNIMKEWHELFKSVKPN